jgi:hypothetical protein
MKRVLALCVICVTPPLLFGCGEDDGGAARPGTGGASSGGAASGGAGNLGSGGIGGAGGSAASGGAGGSAASGGAGGAGGLVGNLACAHVPPGYENVVNRPFDSKAKADNDRGVGMFPDKVGGSEGWDGVEYKMSHLTTHSDANDAPLSPAGYMRWTYWQGMSSGVSPGTAQTQGFTSSTHGGKQYKSLYFCYAFRMSSNYYANPTVGNKMLFLQGGMNNILFLKGKGSGNLSLQVNVQGSGPDGSVQYQGQTLGWLAPNTASAGSTSVNAVERSVWHVIEGQVSLGDLDTANGSWRVWYDGVLTHEYLGIQVYSKSPGSKYLNAFQFSPTYGGGGAGVPHTFTWDVDHVSIWGSPS